MRSARLSRTHRRARHGIASGEGFRALAVAGTLAATITLVIVFAVKAHFNADETPPAMHPSASASSQTRDGEQAHRIASILFVPTRGDTCEKRRFDNSTGRVVFGGYVDCKNELAQAEPASASELRDNTVRIRAILNAFKK